MALKREVSLGVGLATAALVWGVYQSALPTNAETRVSEPDDRHLSGAERSAAWISAAAVAGVSLIARDATVFVLGGGMIVALSWWHRHANSVNPASGTAVGPTSRKTMDAARATSAGYSPS